MDHKPTLLMIQRMLQKLSSQSVLFSQAVAERLGLNPSDLECLGILFEEGATTAGQLAEITGLTTGAITGIVDRLEKAGYVRRQKDPRDRRRVIVEPVAARAEREVEPLFAPLAEGMSELYARYTEEQLALILDFATRALPIAQAATARLRQGDGQSAPLGAVTRGRLIFASGAARVSIHAGAAADDLYQARFDGTPPVIDVRGGTVTIQYRRFSFDWRKRTGDIALNPTIPWQIELLGGASKVDADLHELPLQSVQLTGGAIDIAITLPEPRGTVPVHITGGVNRILITRPPGVAAQARMNGGFQKLTFDGKDCDVASGDSRQATRDYPTATNRYDVTIEGGASRVVIDTASSG